MKTKQTLAFASASVLAAGMAHGNIVYSGSISNLVTTDNSTASSIDLNNDTVKDYTARFDGLGASMNQLKPFIDVRQPNGGSANPNAWALSKPNGGAPLTLFGTMIDSGYAAAFPTNKVAYLYEQYDNGTVVGDWPSTVDTEGYVGIELTDGLTTTNYGWIHLIYNAAASNGKTLTMVDYAYEDVSGKGIPAGAVTDGLHIYREPQSLTVGGGAAAQFRVVALGDPTPAYQWKAGAVGSGIYTNLVDDGNVTGTTTPTLNIAVASPANALDYVVVVTNLQGALTSSPPATLTVIPIVLAGPSPAVEQIFVGGTAHFGVQLISGVSPSYRWRRGGVNLSDSSTVSGSTSSNLVINGLTAGDGGNYDVVLTTPYGAATSSIAPLTVVATNGGAFESALIARGPANYYRLNETTDPSTNNSLAFDNIGAINGIYGPAAWNGNPNYSVAGPRPSDQFPGFTTGNHALFALGNTDGSNVKLPPWNLNTNTVTITAWINPQGAQVGGAAVVYTRSTNNMVCGMAYYGHFGSSDISLGYNWNDQAGAYFWNSGLDVPQNQWSLVSLVITPTNAIVYVFHDDAMYSATNAMTHAVQSFADTIYIGTDPQGTPGSHNFNGDIDEVAAFNRSLSADELTTLYFAARGISSFPPRITQQPQPQNLLAGQTAHFVAGVVGSSPLSCQWKSGTLGVYTNLVDGGPISGATTPNLTVRNVSAGSVADYFLVITNIGGSTNTILAPLAIQPPGGIYESTLAAMNGIAAYYPLDETADPTAGGVVALDYAGGFNGLYGTGVQNGNPSYGIAGPRPGDGFIGFSPTNTAALTIKALGASSEILCPPLNLNANAVTLTAWINPATPPQQWAGLVFCRGAGGMVAGLDFTQINLNNEACLGYHWNDANDTFSWVSGLVPPQNQWSFVALVLDPATTNATIWLINANGVQSASHYSTNNLLVQSFNAPLHIGNDPLAGDGSRVFDGAIDSVGVFAAALDFNQIRSLYGAAVGSVTLRAQQVGGSLQIQWPAGILLEATNLLGPWTTNTATSPYVVVPSAPHKFYKAVLP